MPKLLLELIPKTCHYKNARKKLTTTQWNALRKFVYERADNVCEICGLTGNEQGYHNNLECHEIWSFNQRTYTQKLIGLVALCPLCHQSKHFGRATRMGKKKLIMSHLRKINKWTLQETLRHITKAYAECHERSKYYWKLDLTLLNKNPYILLIKNKAKPIRKSKAKSTQPKKY